MENFPVDRYLRAARGLADLSQRELALKAGVPHQIVAKAEHTPRLARVDDFVRLLHAAGMRLVVADAAGREIAPESEQIAALKDRARRRFPAHLDVRAGSDGWWGDGWPMFDGKTPTHTFDRNRGWRDLATRTKRGQPSQRAPQQPAQRSAQRSTPRPYAGCRW